MTIYNDNIARPYTYKVTFLSGEYYFGYREKNANPKYKLIPAFQDIGSKYFTSSDIIKERGLEGATIEILFEFTIDDVVNVGDNPGDAAYDHEQELIGLHIDDPLCLNKNYRPRKGEARFKAVSHKQPKGPKCKLFEKESKPEHVEKWTGPNHPKYDHTIYDWVHEEHGEFRGTKVELRNQFDFMLLNTSCLSAVVREDVTHHKGWHLKGSELYKKSKHIHRYKKIESDTEVPLSI